MAQLARRHHHPEAIDTTQDGCSGPAAAGMDGSSSSGSSHGSGSSGNSGASGSSHGLVEPASASLAAPPAIRRGTLSSWTVGNSSPPAINVFCDANLPKLSQQARPRVCKNSSPGPPREQSWRKQQALVGSSRQQAKNFPATDSARQFPGQGFTVSYGKVMRTPCAKELRNDKETCKSHVRNACCGEQRVWRAADNYHLARPVRADSHVASQPTLEFGAEPGRMVRIRSRRLPPQVEGNWCRGERREEGMC